MDKVLPRSAPTRCIQEITAECCEMRLQKARFRDPLVVRENLLRPSRYLGFDRDQLGVYFLEREAFDLAESQLRRAVWLNPFEPNFRTHWAESLIRLGRGQEALDVLRALLTHFPNDETAIQLWRRHWPREVPPSAMNAENDAGARTCES